MRLYVDVDETLVFWDTPTKSPFVGDYCINAPLVAALKKGIDLGDYDVTIWSAGGVRWAKEISSDLFFGYHLPFSGKWELYHHIPENSFAIDDRLQSDRFYLYRFEKVFLPEEFVKYAEDIEKRESLTQNQVIAIMLRDSLMLENKTE